MVCNYAVTLVILGFASPQQTGPLSTKSTVRDAVEKLKAYERAKTDVKAWDPTIIGGEALKLNFVFRLAPKSEVHIVYIKNENEMVVRRIQTFWLRGFPTKGLVTGRNIQVPGPLVVSDTASYGGETIFVVSPYDPQGKPTREEFELAAPELEKERLREVKDKAKAIAKAQQEAKQVAEEKAKADAAAAKVKREKAADSKLRFAKQFVNDGKKDTAKQWLRELLRDYGDTSGAADAKKLLEELEK